MWLEPEGLETDVVYPNGISNSMEPEDQLRLLATIPGGFGRGTFNCPRSLARLGSTLPTEQLNADGCLIMACHACLDHCRAGGSAHAGACVCG